MQYTEVSGAIYNHDKHVFPIRTAAFLLYWRESSDRDRFPGIASSTPNRATGYGGGQRANLGAAECATIKGFDSLVELYYRDFILGLYAVYLEVENNV